MGGVFDVEVTGLPKPNYEYITHAEDVPKAFEEIAGHDIIEIDTETTSLDPFKAKMVLMQVGIPNKSFVFDVRYDTEYSDIHPEVFKPILVGNDQTRLLQNAVYDMKIFKRATDFYIENIYDTMLAEQILNLGLVGVRAGLKSLVHRYLGIVMPKEPGSTFQNYGQKFRPFQLEYAANDVAVLKIIKDLQAEDIQKHSFEDVCRLEFEFTKPMCEMELNGITFDIDSQRDIIKYVEEEKNKYAELTNSLFATSEDQTSLFGVPTLNLESNPQLKKALEKHGLPVEDTSEGTLNKYKNVPVVNALLDYRKAQKFISTYGESLIAKIKDETGRLHTRFRQMVKTGRMSSSDPNLQNIPKKQKYRTCFVAKEGYSLITSDMSGAELRILGNLSRDPLFLHCYANGIDIHTKTSAEMFKISMEEAAASDKRGAAKAINFGLCYGLSKYGLAARLGITIKAADKMINDYFMAYKGVKAYLDQSARDGIKKGYTTTISGRKRFYNIPDYYDPNRENIIRSIERAAKNHGVQGCVTNDSNISGIGKISSLVDKKIEINTGFGKDTALGVYSGKKDVYNLKLSNGIELGITLDHKIPTVIDNLIVDTSVDDLTDDNFIMIPLDVIDGSSSDLSGYSYTKGHWRETYKEFDCPNSMDSKLAFILGCLIGDGSYTKHNHFRFVCPETQKELFDKFNSFVYDVFKYKPVVRIEKKGRNVPLYLSQVSSVVIRGFLKHIGLDYVVHRNKNIPKYFFSETIINKGALLNGLFSTDGGIINAPSFTSTSKELVVGVQQLLLSLGINSNLKEYKNKFGFVYRLQVFKRFNNIFKKYIGFSVDEKQNKLINNCGAMVHGDGSIVPEFIPKTIEMVLRKSKTFLKDFTYNERAHLRRFKLGSCSYNSWRKFYKCMPECYEKNILSMFLNYDFCKIESKNYIGKEDTYDLMCDNIHYFMCNGIIIHNSNADTMKQAMIYAVNELEEKGYDAKLLLTVHDEMVVEVKDDQKEEVGKIVGQSLIDGFGKYFSEIPMETDVLMGPCWLKGSCENKIGSDDHTCGCCEMEFDNNKKLVCKECGGAQ
jgi:DNA polymerase-1